MSREKKVDRRKFLGAGLAGAGLVAAGGALGWLASRSRRTMLTGPESRAPLDDRFTYDVREYQHTEPKLLLYDEQGRIPTGLASPKCLAMDARGRVHVAGDQVVRRLGLAGDIEAELPLAGPPTALAFGEDGRLYVGLKNSFTVYDDAGALLAQSDPLGDRVFLTALAQHGDKVYVADAGNREVLICDPTGKVRHRFGKYGAAAAGQGFVVPSPYFDLLFGADGLLWVANPGRHRIEAYTPDGAYETGWGKTGMAVDGFCGCCNPVYFTRLPDGRFVTSEKGLNRIKIYSARGEFEGVVAGPEQLVKDLDAARKACADCSIGFGFAVACDSRSRVYALDPASREVRVFGRKGGAT